MTQEVYHTPALLPQCLDALSIEPEGIYVDATLGGGGHSGAIAARLTPPGHLYSFDQDSDAIERATPTDVFTPVHGNFRYMSNYLDYYGVLGSVDGILADLGVSFHHFDDAARGFSFRAEGPLDMRMNPAASVSAATVVATADVGRLTDIFRIYGELRQARRMAEAIVAARSRSAIDTTSRFVEVVSPFINPAREKKELAQAFQALRIVVNGELDALEAFLNQSLEALRPGGRLAIITYHSLEDRMTKNFMRAGNIEGKEEKDLFGRSSSPFKVLTSKPIVPDDEEIERNPRSRSAKLRVAVKL